jgi:two-component system, cell cycle response regulator DivK
MVVEDSDDNRFMMRRLLEDKGYQVCEASDGEGAVRVAQSQLPDLILMDLSLPRVDGLAATRRIRQLPDLDETPVVAVSAHNYADFRNVALEAGCAEYVTKPIDFDQLEEVLSGLVPNDPNETGGE